MFYNPNPDIFELSKAESLHCAKVLRKQIGDDIEVFDGKGGFYKAVLLSIGKICTYKVIEKHFFDKPKTAIRIAVAPPKSANRFDFMIEKLVEIGLTHLYFLNTARTERVRINEERLNASLVAACKQSLQFYLPEVKYDLKLNDLNLLNQKINVCHCIAEKSRNRIELAQALEGIWCIGPEGDFSEEEIALLAKQNAQFFELGNSRLRTETAAIYVASQIQANGIQNQL